jgi:hypothetical protein
VVSWIAWSESDVLAVATSSLARISATPSRTRLGGSGNIARPAVREHRILDAQGTSWGYQSPSRASYAVRSFIGALCRRWRTLSGSVAAVAANNAAAATWATGCINSLRQETTLRIEARRQSDHLVTLALASFSRRRTSCASDAEAQARSFTTSTKIRSTTTSGTSRSSVAHATFVSTTRAASGAIRDVVNSGRAG